MSGSMWCRRPRRLFGSFDLRNPLVVILLGGAVVRIALWSWFQGLPIAIQDEKDYNLLALNLVEFGEYCFEPGTLTALRPPLYPFLVAGVYKAFGLENYQAVRLLQAALSLLNVVIVYGLAKEVSDRRT